MWIFNAFLIICLFGWNMAQTFQLKDYRAREIVGNIVNHYDAFYTLYDVVPAGTGEGDIPVYSLRYINEVDFFTMYEQRAKTQSDPRFIQMVKMIEDLNMLRDQMEDRKLKEELAEHG